jgi:hypothetical protein
MRRVDRLQPALLIVCLISTIGFAMSAEDAARPLAGLAAAGFLLVLIGSVAWLVPIQRRLVASGSQQPPAYVEGLRSQWLRGHLIRILSRWPCSLSPSSLPSCDDADEALRPWSEIDWMVEQP